MNIYIIYITLFVFTCLLLLCTINILKRGFIIYNVDILILPQIIMIIAMLIQINAINNKIEEGEYINTYIEEASGIDYHKGRDTLFVVDDEGIVFEITKTGQILNQKYLGDYDLEGITINSINTDELILSVEGEDTLLYVNVDSLQILRNIPINRYYKDTEILKADEEYGIEGVHEFGGKIYVINQSYNLNAQEMPEDPSMLFEVKKVNDEFIIDSIVFMPFPDLSGIAELNNELYLISGDENVILVYDFLKNEIVEEIDIPVTGNQEGVTFDNDSYIYIAIDGEGIFKTKLEVNNVGRK